MRWKYWYTARDGRGWDSRRRRPKNEEPKIVEVLQNVTRRRIKEEKNREALLVHRSVVVSWSKQEGVASFRGNLSVYIVELWTACKIRSMRLVLVGRADWPLGLCTAGR